MAVKIVTDSTGALPKKYIEEYDITLVSLSIILGNQSIKETDIDPQTFYDKIEQLDTIPTTSQPSVEDMFSAFEKHIKNNDQVIAIFISSKKSGTYNSSILAKEMILEKYPKASIHIVDSESTSMQLGFLAKEAGKAAKKGKSVNEILKLVEEIKKCSRLIFIPKDLSYLKKGGRIGNSKALIADILKIKPVLTVENGITDTAEKIRTKKKAIQFMINMLMQDINKCGYGDAIIHHINAESDAKNIMEQIRDTIGITLEIIPIGGVVGSHVGPGAIGLVYYTKQPLR